MFGELDDSDIYVNNQSDDFGASSDTNSAFSFDDESEGLVNSFENELNAEEMNMFPSSETKTGAFNEPTPESVDPMAFGDSPAPKKPMVSSGFIYLIVLVLLFASAVGMFMYKKSAPLPEAPDEQAMGDYFYDKASGGAKNPDAAPVASQDAAPVSDVSVPAGGNESVATVDVVLDGNNPAAPMAKTEKLSAKTSVKSEKPALTAEKSLSAIDRAMMKKAADDTKLKQSAGMGKSVTIAVTSGGRENPFLPYNDFASSAEARKFDLIAPPIDIPETDPVIDEIMQTKISGIMYDKVRPSAIVNFGGADQLVHRGDIVKGYKVVDITKNTVVLKYKSNIYQATVGQTLNEGINLNPVSNLSRQFGGVYSPASNALQFN